MGSNNKKYYWKNKNELSTKHKVYYQKNRNELLTKTKAYYQENHKKIKLYKKVYEDEHRDKRRNRYIKRKYGITTEEWNQILENQNFSCAVCKCTETSH